MLLKIIGWLYLIGGIFYMIKPVWLQNKFKKKSIKKVKQICFVLVLMIGTLLIKATWGMEGLIPKIIMILGFIGILKAFFFLKAKAADNLLQWWLKQPPNFFRMNAVAMLVFGTFLVYCV